MEGGSDRCEVRHSVPYWRSRQASLKPPKIHLDAIPADVSPWEVSVSNSNLETLKLLKQELAFLERGGYGGSVPWRPVSFFLDSPSCPNRLHSDRTTPCRQCWLHQFVPKQFLEEPTPCHRIALNSDDESVHTMSRQYTPVEVEEAVRTWLIGEIRRLEEAAATSASN